jgi:Na+-transporting NADH:ubiquinone oxidoreductase subunit NqrD
MFLTINDYLLPCLNKSLFGIDCPGCGVQRAFVLLIKGNFTDAFKMYPAIYTLVLFAIFLLINYRKKIKNSRKIIISFAIINLLIIIISYGIKMKPIFTL